MIPQKFDLSGLSVVIAIPVRDIRDCNWATTTALIGIITLLHQYGVEWDYNLHTSGVLPGTRSMCVHRFLESKANRLFWLDSDIVPKPEDFMQMLAWSTIYPVIAAAYTAKEDKPFFLLSANPGEVKADQHGNINLDGLGLGFCCMQREVLEKLSAIAPPKKFKHDQPVIPGVFRFDEVARDGYDEFSGEDTNVFQDIRKLGYTVMVDPRIRLGHVGDKTYFGRLIDHIVKKDAAAAA